MRAPMLIPFIAIAIGVLTALDGFGVWLGLASVIAGVSLYLYILAARNYLTRFYRLSPLHYVWIAFCFCGIGNISGNISSYNSPSPDLLNHIAAIEGTVENIEEKAIGDIVSLECHRLYWKNGNPDSKNRFKVRMTVPAFTHNIGDRILFPADKLREIKTSEKLDNTSYVKAMKERGFYYSIKISDNQITKVGHSLSLDYYSNDLRNKFVAFIEKQPLQSNTRNFLISVLSGDKTYLDNETRTLFANAGVAHILALSGFHIGIIASILLLILFPLNFAGKYKLRYFLTALLLWIYTFLTGFSPSLVRACTMISVFILAMILERKNTALNSLCLAGFLILLFSPYSLLDVGFQLSFVCVGALILFSSHLNPIDYRFHPKLHNLAALILASIISTTASWIIVAYHFHTFPINFLPANLLILPLMPIYILIALLYLFLRLFDIDLYYIEILLNKLYDYSLSFMKYLGEGTVLEVSPPGWTVVLWMAMLAVMAYFLNRKHYKPFT